MSAPNVPKLVAQAGEPAVRRDLLEIARWAASLGLTGTDTISESTGTALLEYQRLDEKGVPGGYAPLGLDNIVPPANLPDLVPAAIPDGDKGDVVVSDSGSTWTIDAESAGLAEESALDELYRKFRLLLRAWITTGLPLPVGLEDEYDAALSME